MCSKSFNKLSDLEGSAGELVSFMLGRFTNEAQAAKAPDDFFLVEYSLCQVNFNLENSSSTYFLYIEQIIFFEGQKMLRQSIYSCKDLQDNRIDVSHHHIDPTYAQSLLGICQNPTDDRQNLDPSKIQWNWECHSFYQKVNESEYHGRSQEGGCPSTYAGSSYFTENVTISDGKVEPWERWFNAAGEQMAGPTAGPYIYLRVDDKSTSFNLSKVKHPKALTLLPSSGFNLLR